MDKGRRAGALCVLTEGTDDAVLNLTIDDCVQKGEVWHDIGLFTEFEVSRKALFEGSLPKDLLENVGLAVLLRLAAKWELGNKP